MLLTSLVLFLKEADDLGDFNMCVLFISRLCAEFLVLARSGSWCALPLFFLFLPVSNLPVPYLSLAESTFLFLPGPDLAAPCLWGGSVRVLVLAWVQSHCVLPLWRDSLSCACLIRIFLFLASLAGSTVLFLPGPDLAEPCLWGGRIHFLVLAWVRSCWPLLLWQNALSCSCVVRILLFLVSLAELRQSGIENMHFVYKVKLQIKVPGAKCLWEMNTGNINTRRKKKQWTWGCRTLSVGYEL